MDLLEEKVDLEMGSVVASTVANALEDKDKLEAGGGGGGAGEGTAHQHNLTHQFPTPALICF